jgi:glycosyltransferase involved in cell wall biosynthesis
MVESTSRIKLCALAPYPADMVPGQRFRIEQWLPELAAQGIDVELMPFADRELMRILHQPGRHGAKAAALSVAFLKRLGDVAAATRYDAVLVHRAICIVGPALLERALKLFGKPLIFDFDDAIFRLHTDANNRWFGWLKFPGKTAAICRLSSHIVVGNAWLGEYARQFNPRVTVVPTSIDTAQYQPLTEPRGNGRVVVGWTGSSTSMTYLEMFAPTLRELLKLREVEIRVISNREPELPGIPFNYRPWRPETEIEEIGRLDIGLMPMPDDEWARGKCALKALQYMAMGVPTICTSVGANCEVIEHGRNGMLAYSEAEWLACLTALIDDAALRARLGQAGRQTIEAGYSMRSCAAAFASVVRETVRQKPAKQELQQGWHPQKSRSSTP